MPGTRRTPIGRPPKPRVTPRAVDLFERGLKLMARKPSAEIESELADVSSELHSELGLLPWADDVLVDCDCRLPPAFLTTEGERDNWFMSRALREQLQTELYHRRKAAREARRAAKHDEQKGISNVDTLGGDPPAPVLPHAREAREDVEIVEEPASGAAAPISTSPAPLTR